KTIKFENRPFRNCLTKVIWFSDLFRLTDFLEMNRTKNMMRFWQPITTKDLFLSKHLLSDKELTIQPDWTKSGLRPITEQLLTLPEKERQTSVRSERQSI